MINSINNVTFKGDLNKKQENEKQIASKENSFDKKKIALALAGLAAASIAAVAIIKKSNAPLDLSLEEFKEKGGFDKGSASFNNKPYTGKITIPKGDDKIIFEYSKGNLVESTKYKYLNPLNDFIKEWKKTYTTNQGAKTIQQYKYNNKGEERLLSTTTYKNNEIKSQYKNSFWNETLNSSVIKQEDGSFLSTKEEIKMGPSTNSYRINTINTKTKETINQGKLKKVKTKKTKQHNK